MTEELAAGDADIAATLAETSRLGHLLFDQAMSSAQRKRWLPLFLDNDRCHLAFAHHETGTSAGFEPLTFAFHAAMCWKQSTNS